MRGRTEVKAKAMGEFRIAHLSDPHVNSDQSAFRHRLRSWARQPFAKNLLNLQAVMRDLAQRDIDHLVLTGDLAHNARDEEFTAIREALGEYAQPGFLTVVPGNHDLSYGPSGRKGAREKCPRKLRRLVHHFPELFPATYPSELGRAKKLLFPFVRVVGDGRIVLIGLDTTGRLTKKAGPLNSFGTISRPQMRELRELLKHPWVQDRIKIVVMHHHPVIVPVATMFDSFKHLFQSKQLLDLLYESHVDLILHGHKHHPFCWQSHTFRDHDLTVICAGPPDAYANGQKADLVYNIYSIVEHHIGIHYQTCRPTARPRTEFTHASKHYEGRRSE